MARSSVNLRSYRFEILHECGEVELSDQFPPGLVNKWIHKDIVETILRLGGIINDAYRATATIAVGSGQALTKTGISHSSAALVVTGFSGLTPDAWIGGSILLSNATDETAGTMYAAQITDNDATTVTISNGSDLPVVSSKPCILTKNNSGSSIDLSSLAMINFKDPIWKVLTDAGVPVPPMNIDLAQNIANVPSYDGKIYWYKKGQYVVLALGSGAVASGSYTIGYFILPTEASAETDYIDFPIEYHTLAQMKTVIRILKKKGEAQAAVAKENDLEAAFAKVDESNTTMLARDKVSGSRK
jgi:hypothetical protein